MPHAFTDHVALLTAYLDRRAFIVDAIERQMLNVQDKGPARSRDRSRLELLLVKSIDEAVALPRRSRSCMHRSPPPTWKTASSLSPGTLTRTGSIPRIS